MRIPTSAQLGIAVGGQQRSRAADWSCMPTDTVYGIGADAFDSTAVAALLSAKGRGRDMPVRCAGRLLAHHRGTGLHDAGRGPRADPRVLAGRAEPGGAAGAVAAMGSRRCPRHGDAANAAAPRRHRAAARGRTDGGVERQRLRPLRRGERRRGAQPARRSGRRLSGGGSVRAAGRLHDRRPDRCHAADSAAGSGERGADRGSARRRCRKA